MQQEKLAEQIVCTNCGAPMYSRSCKMRCPSCGYFEDCSDTGLPSYTAPQEELKNHPESKT